MVFVLVQIAFTIALRRDTDAIIRFGVTFRNGLLYGCSFMAFWFALVHAMVFLVEGGTGWGITTSMVIVATGLVSTATLLTLHWRLLEDSLR
jgi:hypothetical protein